MKGVVTKSTGSWYTVFIENGTKVECRLKGKFRLKGIKSTNPVAVGDHVNFEYEEGKDTGVIHKIVDRKNYIIRKSVNLSKQTHIIAANIDLAFLMVTLKSPETFPSFIDRFLATAEAYNITTVILFNKIDIYDDDLLKIKNNLKNIYTTIGYQCLDISATENINVDALKELMKDKVSLFSGHSGVGKSTLINTIEPKLNIKTTAISEQHKSGQHTTTFAEMYQLSFGGFIIDTPGIKGFGVVDFEKFEVGDYFPEIFKHKSECKYNNCLHLDEPKCAIKEAVANNKISSSRYRSYLQLLDKEKEHFRINSYDF